HIACGVNVRDVGPKSIVHDNASIRMGHARMVEREASDIRTTAGGDQDTLPVRLAAHIGHDDDSCGLLSDSDGTSLKPTDAFALEYALKDARRLWIVVRQQTRRHDGDLAAETLKGLRELHAERTAADDEQRCR